MNPIPISPDLIITFVALLTAIATVITYCNKIHDWIQKMDNQDEEIKDIKEEQRILVGGILACLKGLKEQGCNGPVTQGIADIEDYINIKAHED